MTRAAITPEQQADARACVRTAIVELRMAVEIAGDVQGISAHAYRSLGTTLGFLEAIDSAPTVDEEKS
jgi:hypothetical protein